MTMLEWAKNEVEIACKKEAPDRQTWEWDYGCSCYESALKAFESLCEDGHSGMSIQVTKHILDKLIEGKALTPIYDTQDVWEELGCSNDGQSVEYQCKRMSSLFKTIHNDGRVEYTDNSRVIGVDKNGLTFLGGRIREIVDERYPITMPYCPPSKPFKVYTEDFLVDPANGDYDTEGILYMITPEGERVDLDMYWTEKESRKMFEITKEEYLELKKKAEERTASEV